MELQIGGAADFPFQCRMLQFEEGWASAPAFAFGPGLLSPPAEY